MELERARSAAETAYTGERSIENADALIAALEREIEAKESQGIGEEQLGLLRKMGLKMVHERNALVLMDARTALRSIIDREYANIDMAYRTQLESGWFGMLSSGLTGSNPYEIERGKSENALFRAERLERKILKEAFDELHKGPYEADMGKVKEIAAKVEAGIRNINKVDTDTSHFDEEQEALTLTRNVSIAVITAPAAFVGGSAGAGIAGAARFGALQGAKVAFVSSGAGNVEDVQRGAKTVGEAVKDTSMDTAIGAGAGAVIGTGFAKGSQAVRGATQRMRSAPKARSESAPQAKPKTHSGAENASRQQTSTERTGAKARESAKSSHTETARERSSADRADPRGGPTEKPGARPRATEDAPQRGAETKATGTSAERPQSGFKRIDPRLNPDNIDDAYKILGLEKGAPRKAVEKAFRRLHFKYHPDIDRGLNPSIKDIYTQNGKIISSAHQTISKSWRNVEG